MKTKLEINLKPFKTPNFILEQKTGGMQTDDNPRSFELKMFDARTLEKMCEEFTDAVFRKAGKRRPPQNEAEFVPLKKN